MAHLNGQSQKVVIRAKKTRIDVDKEIVRLKRLNQRDVEVSHYMALLIALSHLPDSLINDTLFSALLEKINLYFMLFRYHNDKGYDPSFFAASRGISYMKHWGITSKGDPRNPDTLFTQAVLTKEAEKNPLSYTSFCCNPFCSLVSASNSTMDTYNTTRETVLQKMLTTMGDSTELSYISFASGQFGKDILRLHQIKTLLSHRRSLSSLTLYFVDPFNMPYVQMLFGNTVSEIEKLAICELQKKAFEQTVLFLQALFDCDICIHLCPLAQDAMSVLKTTHMSHCLLMAEDYYISDKLNPVSNQSVKDQFDALKVLAKKQSRHFFQFEAVKTADEGTLYLNSEHSNTIAHQELTL